MDSLVSTQWLAEHLREPGLSIVDASWHMPATARSGCDEFAASHIPGAVFLDIDALSDRENPAPHMLPAAKDFAAAMERLGVGRDERIIVYDNSPLRTAARGWFMLRHFGARDVAILDGGFQKWIAEGRETEAGRDGGRARLLHCRAKLRNRHQGADPEGGGPAPDRRARTAAL
jgi:thiosulfate/3-mercaptopyruvate sulfurtransferase